MLSCMAQMLRKWLQRLFGVRRKPYEPNVCFLCAFGSPSCLLCALKFPGSIYCYSCSFGQFFLYQKSPHKNKADGHADITCWCDQVDVFRSPMSSLAGWDRKVNLTRVTAALQHLVDTRLIGTTCVASLAAAVLSSIISFLAWASLCFTTECGRIVVQFGPSPGISHVATDQGTHGVLSCE